MLQLERLLPGRFPIVAPALSRRVLVVNGHPRPDRFCASLCDAYEEGAQAGGWEVERLNAGAFASTEALAKIRWARHLAVIFPLRDDRPPAALHDLFARYARLPAAEFPSVEQSVRTIILMDMPAFAYRDLLQNKNNHNNDNVCALRRHIALPGLFCDDQLFIGGVKAISAGQCGAWLQDMHRLGLRGA